MKRIIFLCGSLVPGRDGVGDYTRLLATGSQAHGHEVLIIATHDRGVSSTINERQESNNTSVNVVRIPFATKNNERIKELQHQTDTFKPGWISLQYVPYSFSKYGIPLEFIRCLRHLKGMPKLHVMFHELWIVPGDLNGIKGRFVAFMQRRAVSLLGRKLHPDVVHTHLPAYARRLKELGIKARPLPLFANVGRTATDAATKTGVFNAVFFSKIFFPPAVITLLSKLIEDQKNVKVSLLGGSKEKALKAAETLRSSLPGIEVDPVGFLSEQELSEQLTAADLAISPVPLHLLGKSGTIAAFFSHNLPVAAPRIVEKGEGFFLSPLNESVFSAYSPEAFEKAREAAKKLDTEIISVATISRQFSEDLGEGVSQLAL